MSDTITSNFALPLLVPSQAQKHVTVNDALMRLDGQVDMVLQSITRNTPPEAVVDGQCWGVPANGINAWQGQGGNVAIGANGGWLFASPVYGRRALIADQGVQAVHDGQSWVPGALTLGEHGSGMLARQITEDVAITAGSTVRTMMGVPAGAMMIGATARVIESIPGTATSWQMGHVGAANRFGQGLGLSQGSWSRGILSAPMTYWSTVPIQLAAVGGTFSGGGLVRVVLHFWELRIPN